MQSRINDCWSMFVLGLEKLVKLVTIQRVSRLIDLSNAATAVTVRMSALALYGVERKGELFLDVQLQHRFGPRLF